MPSGWSKDGNAFTTSEECGLDFGYSNKKIFGENETTKETGFTIEYVFNQAQEKKLCPGGYKYPISQMVSAHRWNEIAGEMTVEDGIVNINTNRYSGKVYHLENYTVPLNKNVSIAMSLSPYADGKHVAKFYVNGQLKQINNVKYPIESTNCTICNDCYMRVNQLNYYTTNASFVGKLYAVRYSFAVLSDRAIYRNFRVDARKYGIEVQ